MKEFGLALAVVFGAILFLVGSGDYTNEIPPPRGMEDCKAYEQRKNFVTNTIVRCPNSKTSVDSRRLVGKLWQNTHTETDEE